MADLRRHLKVSWPKTPEQPPQRWSLHLHFVGKGGLDPCSSPYDIPIIIHIAHPLIPYHAPGRSEKPRQPDVLHIGTQGPQHVPGVVQGGHRVAVVHDLPSKAWNPTFATSVVGDYSHPEVDGIWLYEEHIMVFFQRSSSIYSRMVYRSGPQEA